MDNDFAEAESLRLLKAFRRVRNDETRKLIIELVEAAERGDNIAPIFESLNSAANQRRH